MLSDTYRELERRVRAGPPALRPRTLASAPVALPFSSVLPLVQSVWVFHPTLAAAAVRFPSELLVGCSLGAPDSAWLLATSSSERRRLAG